MSDARMRKYTKHAPSALPHFRMLCAKPKQAPRESAGARSLMSASRGAACTPLARRSSAFDANSEPTCTGEKRSAKGKGRVRREVSARV